MVSEDLGVVRIAVVLRVVSDGDVEVVPPDDSADDDIDGGSKEHSNKVCKLGLDQEENSRDNGCQDTEDEQKLPHPDNLAGCFLVVCLPPLPPDECDVD